MISVHLLAALAVLLTACGGERARPARATPPARVLFIGNSYTYENDLPGMVARAAASTTRPVRLQVESVTTGGKNLRWHWEQGDALARIEAGHFDHVVIQGHSLEPILERDDFRRYASRFARAARAQGARPVLYMTWARAEGDALYTVPDVGRNPAQMQARVAEGYASVARATGAELAPVGLAWYRARRALPWLSLHAADGSHPSRSGSYLAACVLRHAIAPESGPVEWKPLGVAPDDARVLREIADRARWPAAQLGVFPAWR